MYAGLGHKKYKRSASRRISRGVLKSIDVLWRQPWRNTLAGLPEEVHRFRK